MSDGSVELSEGSTMIRAVTVPDRPAHHMRMLVLSVLGGVRACWTGLTIRDKQKVVRHMRVIADLIERSIGGPPP
jgi:hypothetical protein